MPHLSNSPRLPRKPDIDQGGLQTFYVGMGGASRVMALQLGAQPGDQRVSLRIAALIPGLLNPPLPERTLQLTLPTSHPRSPRIFTELESELPQGMLFEKMLLLSVNDSPESPQISVVLHYGRPLASVPFPSKDPSASGYWRTERSYMGWAEATDGYDIIAVDFPSNIPGSLHRHQWKPFVHPGLGPGFLDIAKNKYHPWPRGRPDPEAFKETLRFGLHLLPVAGLLVMAGEALVGRSIWGRQLSTAERMVLGAGAVLSVLGPLLSRGSAVLAARRLSHATGMNLASALRMIEGGRLLTPMERAKLERLAAKVKSGQSLAADEERQVKRIVGKLSEPTRVRSIRAEVVARTGKAHQPGRFFDLAPRTSPDETRVGQVLARELRADVIRAPESTIKGHRSSDYLLNDRLAEVASPTTSSLENVLRKAADKHSQAGTLIIDLTHCPLPPDKVIASTERLFYRPEAADVERVIFIKGQRILDDVPRPASARDVLRPVATGDAGPLIRGGASAASRHEQE